MRSSFRTWSAVTGTAAVAALGLLIPTAADAAQLPAASASTLISTKATGAENPATSLSMTFVNNTSLTLTLVNAGHDGSGTHWENRPPQTLAPGATGTASAYSSTDTGITLIYQNVSGGNSSAYTMKGSVPLAGGNSASGSATAGYQVTASHSTGYHATASYNIQPGDGFHYIGGSTTYTVPYGVTQLKMEAIGGGAQAAGYGLGPTYGADITGILPVTPGETLLIGVAGAGGGTGTAPDDDTSIGGWGITYNGDNYSGGSTVVVFHDEKLAEPGGGATVVIDQGTGKIIAVAGGAGGSGDSSGTSGACVHAYYGGNGGADGAWTGGNGQPAVGGGAAGGNTTSTGQSSTSTDTCAGGAGGGGVNGGLAGADGGGYGGGAGSSTAPGLTNPTVTTADQNGEPQNGSVILSAAN
jgi:hypothetical protein